MRNAFYTFKWRWSGLLTEERNSFGPPRLRKRTESRIRGVGGAREVRRRAACTLLSLNDGGDDAQPPERPAGCVRGGGKSVGSKVNFTLCWR